jgi:hypothetical protein
MRQSPQILPLQNEKFFIAREVRKICEEGFYL